LLLDVLWRNGFIYGYNKIKDNYLIFLKYDLQGWGILDSTIFLDSKLTNRQFKTLLLLDAHYSYLVLTCKGIFIYSISNSVEHAGRLIAKF
jgi:hypothetical protein